jgi:hypothetical protein
MYMQVLTELCFMYNMKGFLMIDMEQIHYIVVKFFNSYIFSHIHFQPYW